jgi:hypothetical protein
MSVRDSKRGEGRFCLIASEKHWVCKPEVFLCIGSFGCGKLNLESSWFGKLYVNHDQGPELFSCRSLDVGLRSVSRFVCLHS